MSGHERRDGARLRRIGSLWKPKPGATSRGEVDEYARDRQSRPAPAHEGSDDVAF